MIDKPGARAANRRVEIGIVDSTLLFGGQALGPKWALQAFIAAILLPHARLRRKPPSH